MNEPISTRHRLRVVLTLAGLLHVRVCRLCAALVLAEGLAQHERMHAAGGAR